MKLYTKTVCPKCILVKKSLERNDVEVELINIDNNEEAKLYLIDNGIMSAPVFELDGELLTDVSEIMERIEYLK